MKTFLDRLKEEKIKNFPPELLNEGLIKSINYKQMEQHLSKLFNNVDLDGGGINITTSRKEWNKNTYEKFQSLLRIGGYLISYYIIDGDDINDIPDIKDIFSDYNTMTLHLIKKFDAEEKDIPEYLYHVTEKIYLDKILKNGLIPKTKNKIEKHPERTYVIDSYEGALDFENMLFDMYTKKYTILKIDVKLLNRIKLYHDPTFFENETENGIEYNAYYTYDNIPNFAITIMEK